MAQIYRSKGKGHSRRVYPISAPSPRLARSTDRDWIEKSDNPKHNGYVREYMMEHYGKDAFTETGTIRMDYLEKAIQETHDRHEITWEKRLVRARTLKREQGKKKDPYGEPKEKAAEQARKLREEGDRVRVEETSRKDSLYAPFIGERNIGEQKMKDLPKAPEPPRKKLTYNEAHNNMKEVPVELRLSGDRRKGSIYAAVVTGTDPKYGLKREFLNGDRTYTGKNDLTVDYKATLKPGTIIETGEAGSWKNKYGSYYIVTKDGLKHLTSNYNGEGRLKVKDIMKAREKAINGTG